MHEALADLAYRHATQPSGPSIPRVNLYFAHETSLPTPKLYLPMLCIVLRGAKDVMIGDRILRYDTDNYYIGSVEVPTSSSVLEASKRDPYVSSSLALDQEVLAGLMADMACDTNAESSAFAVSTITPELRDVWARMLRLLDAPEEIEILAPLFEREILYRVLRGPQGALLRQAARADGRIAHVRRAISHLRANFDRHVRIEELAEIAGMSTPTFHRHFRAATAISPLQYQKALRLQEARRRLIAEADAVRAAYAVGYGSASQFSRDYTRMFGLSPIRDADRIRANGAKQEIAI